MNYQEPFRSDINNRYEDGRKQLLRDKITSENNDLPSNTSYSYTSASSILNNFSLKYRESTLTPNRLEAGGSYTSSNQFFQDREEICDSEKVTLDGLFEHPFRGVLPPAFPPPIKVDEHFKEIDPSLISQPTETERNKDPSDVKHKYLKTWLQWHHLTGLPYLTIIITLSQICVFIVELVRMSNLTGSAFQTKPYFNPLLGPSTYLLINMGARFAPCMTSIQNITNETLSLFPCANSTSYDTNKCPLPELCGLGGITIEDGIYAPHQWYRLIIPIFLHSGFLHIIFNLLLQIIMGSSIERRIGSVKFFIIYCLSGISGFLLGANFLPREYISTGASGSLFGILAANIILHINRVRKSPNLNGPKHGGLYVFFIIIEVIICIVMGFLPGVDNFSNIGGFAMGLMLSILLLPDPYLVYENGTIHQDSADNSIKQFIDNWNPFYGYNKKITVRFYVWCFIRVVALSLVIVYMTLLVKNFFNNGILPEESTCLWCRYFNCIPKNGWCDSGKLLDQGVSSQEYSSISLPSTSSTLTQNTSTPTSLLSVTNTNADPFLNTQLATDSTNQQPSSTGSGLSNFAQEILDRHNNRRALHDAPPLEWNNTLVEYAQAYAESAFSCRNVQLIHSGGPYGENLAAGYNGGSSPVDAWYDEISLYNFSNPGYSEETGHFTQLIWDSTSQLGCYEIMCDNEWGQYTICEYSKERGNIVGINPLTGLSFFEENVRDIITNTD